MKRKILSLFLVLALVISAVPAMSFSDLGGVTEILGTEAFADVTLTGSGTAEDPYQIGTASQLEAFRDLINTGSEKSLCAKLIDDIDLNGVEWIPIGGTGVQANTGYAGTFDGNYKRIYNATITDYSGVANNWGVGLFGIANGATIENLAVEATVTSAKSACVGGIIGRTDGNAVIENCKFDGSVTIRRKLGSNLAAAGIVGKVYSAGTVIRNCVNNGSIESNESEAATGSFSAGGIVGYAAVLTTISNCYNTGDVTAKTYAGGISGNSTNSGSTLTNCYNVGTVTAATMGEICAQAARTKTNCFTSEEATSQKATLAETLGDAFVADNDNINNGYPILSWQADSTGGSSQPAPVEPKITVSSSNGNALYMVNSKTTPQPSTVLTATCANMGDSYSNVEWTVTDNQNAITWALDESAEKNNAIKVTALRPGIAKIKASSIYNSNTIDSEELVVNVMPYITTVEIDGTPAVGQKSKAKINIFSLNAGDPTEYNSETMPTISGISWNYYDTSTAREGEQIGSGAEITVPDDATGKNIVFSFWYSVGGSSEKKQSHYKTVAASAEEHVQELNERITNANDALGGLYKLNPKFGTDTNVLTMIKNDLRTKGFEDVNVVIKSIEPNLDASVLGDASIASNGDIIYFYKDPNTTPSSRVGSFKVTFTISKETETLDKDVTTVFGWDADKVKATINSEIVSKVTSANICAEGDTPAAVTKDLSLPKYIDSKYWTEIKWSSNNPAVRIQNNVNSSADVYNPYVGKVSRQETDTEVTLTAEYTFNLVANDGSEEITVTKEYNITVKGDTAAAAKKRELEQKLTNGFANPGMKDYVTGETIDPAHVVNDIQLPTTRDFGVDGAVCPVTVTSSDPTLLKVESGNNVARVFALRPLPGSAAKTAKITVTITDSESGISASKEIELTVDPITTEELNAEIALMEQVKEHYFDGIKNANESKDAVSSNMHAFQEAYLENGQLKFVYDNRDVKNCGIIADAMPGFEPGVQEQWRAFKSSNNSIVTHENLLVSQPQYDTEVTIESALTSSRFKAIAEANPTNAQLQKLYKQPVSVTVTVKGTAGEVTLEGSGTAEAPYLISSAEQLKKFAKMVNTGSDKGLCAKLTADISLDGETWTPIGGKAGDYSAATGYTGTFDGNGKKVTGLDINIPDVGSKPARGIGLFGIVNDGEIKNLIVTGNVSSNSNAVGGIIGLSYGSTKVQNCQFSGSVTNGQSGTSVGTAGIVGAIGTNGDGLTVTCCANFASIKSTAAKGAVGGILGNGKSCTIENCYNAGDIYGGNDSSTKIGGIVGNTTISSGKSNSVIKNVYNIGAIKNAEGGDSCRGRIVGNAVSANISNCYSIDIENEKLASTSVTPTVNVIEQTDAGKAALLTALGASFTADTKGINNGYPVLKWQVGDYTGGEQTGGEGQTTVDPATVTVIANFYNGSTKAQIIPYGEYTATSGLAKAYGYGGSYVDEHAANGEVTMFDMFISMMAAKYGISGPDAANAATLKSKIEFNESFGSIDKIDGRSTFDAPWFGCMQNSSLPAYDTYFDQEDHELNGKSIDDAVISDNDVLNYYFNQVSEYSPNSDKAAYFTQNDKKVTTITVKANEAFSVGLEGYSLYYGHKDAETKAANTAVISGIQLATSEKNGSFTDIQGAVTDENGNAGITFSNPGTYIVTARGNATTPLVTPFLKVNVTAVNTGGTTGGKSSGGSGGGGGVAPTTTPEIKPETGAPIAKTEEKTDSQGNKIVTVTDVNGKEASGIELSDKAVKEAAETGKPVEIAVPTVKPMEDKAAAPTVSIALPKGTDKAPVSIPVAEADNNTVLMKVNEDGSLTPVVMSVLSEDGTGMVATVEEGNYVVVENKVSFSDVQEDAWYESGVNFTASRGLMVGTGEGKFDQQAPLTTAQTAAVIGRMKGEGTSESWNAAVEKFGNTEINNRQNTISMLYEAYKELGGTVATVDTGKVEGFNDADAISAENMEAVRWAIEMGLINGVGEGRIDPLGELTRGQFSTMIERFVKLVQGVK